MLFNFSIKKIYFSIKKNPQICICIIIFIFIHICTTSTAYAECPEYLYVQSANYDPAESRSFWYKCLENRIEQIPFGDVPLNSRVAEMPAALLNIFQTTTMQVLDNHIHANDIEVLVDKGSYADDHQFAGRPKVGTILTHPDWIDGSHTRTPVSNRTIWTRAAGAFRTA